MNYHKIGLLDSIKSLPLLVVVLSILIFPFSRTGHMVSFVFLVFLSLIYSLRNFSLKSNLVLLTFIVLLWHFTTGLIGGLNSSYWADFDTKLVLFVYPLVLWALRKELKNLNGEIIGQTVILSTSVASICTIFVGLIGYLSTGLTSRLTQTFVVMDEMHPSYYGLILCMGLWFIVYRMIKRDWNDSLAYFLLILHICSIAMVSARSVMLVSIILIGLLVFYWIGKRQWRQIAVLAVLGSGLFFYSSNVQNSFVQRFAVLLKSEPGSQKKATIRLRIWNQAIDAIKESPIYGYGPGNEQGVLNQLYESHQLDLALKQELNAHNQYLQTLLSSGLIGGILLLALMSIVISQAIITRNYILLGLQLVFGIAFLFESMFELKAGVFHYAFFTTLLYLYDESSANS